MSSTILHFGRISDWIIKLFSFPWFLIRFPIVFESFLFSFCYPCFQQQKKPTSTCYICRRHFAPSMSNVFQIKVLVQDLWDKREAKLRTSSLKLLSQARFHWQFSLQLWNEGDVFCLLAFSCQCPARRCTATGSCSLTSEPLCLQTNQ